MTHSMQKFADLVDELIENAEGSKRDPETQEAGEAPYHQGRADMARAIRAFVPEGPHTYGVNRKHVYLRIRDAEKLQTYLGTLSHEQLKANGLYGVYHDVIEGLSIYAWQQQKLAEQT